MSAPEISSSVLLRSEETGGHLAAIELTTAGPGALAFAPRGVHHTLANLSDAEARYVLVCTPGGFERRFDPEPSEPYPETIVVGPRIGHR